VAVDWERARRLLELAAPLLYDAYGRVLEAAVWAKDQQRGLAGERLGDALWYAERALGLLKEAARTLGEEGGVERG